MFKLNLIQAEKISLKKKINKSELESEQFSSIAEFYQNTFSNPSKDGVIEYYLKNFTRVKINKPQQLRFLSDISFPVSFKFVTPIDDVVRQSDLNPLPVDLHWSF